jgi:hypothetical protein
MARRKPDQGPFWPAWFYGPHDGECAIFAKPEDVPEGWSRKAEEAEPAVEARPTETLDRDALIAELTARNIPVKPSWGTAHIKRIIDGDVSPTW